jgi:hypothetical protein
MHAKMSYILSKFETMFLHILSKFETFIQIRNYFHLLITECGWGQINQQSNKNNLNKFLDVPFILVTMNDGEQS